jgi:hypothetical protein
MLLRCNPDAADAINEGGQTPMQCLHLCNWRFFGHEKKQVMNDMEQHCDRRRSMRRSVVRIILDRQLNSANDDLVPLIIEYLTLRG